MTKQISKMMTTLVVALAVWSLAGCCTMHRDPDRPRIVWQPERLVSLSGDEVKLSVQVKGREPLYFEWLYQANDFSIPAPPPEGKVRGADSRTLIISEASTNDSGIYTCLVSRDDPKKGALQTRSCPIYLNVLPLSLMSGTVGWPGTIHMGTQPPSYCRVPPYVACSVISPCPSNLGLNWKPAVGATKAKVTIRNCEDIWRQKVWIAYKLIDAPTPVITCAKQCQIEFNLPPGTSGVILTVYFTAPPPTNVSQVWIDYEGLVKPSCP